MPFSLLIISITLFLTGNESIQEVLFFPQMRPEKKSNKVELTENEKLIIKILNSYSEIAPLAEIKDKSELSGKKWDKSIKNLVKNSVIEIISNENGIYLKSTIS